jgi:PilZ domain
VNVSQTGVPREEGTVRVVSRGNRRATIRYRCAPATVGKVISTDDREFQRAWIIDLSLSGVGMQLPRPLATGQHITLMMRSNDGTLQFELSATVTHCDPAPHGDWHVGCEFTIALTPDELDQLL